MAGINDVPRLLEEGRIDIVEQILSEVLDKNPEDPQAREYMQLLMQMQQEAPTGELLDGELPEGVEGGIEGEEIALAESTQPEPIQEMELNAQVESLLGEALRLEEEGAIDGVIEVLAEAMQLIQNKLDSLQGIPQG